MEPTVFDIFNNDAFSLGTLTGEINKEPFVPHQVSDLGIFEEKSINTTMLVMDEYEGTLSLIPATERGGPANQNKHGKRVARAIEVPHFPLEDKVKAEEVQNARGFGATTKLMSVQELVMRRLREMKKKHDATLEYGRIGALKGQVLDSDGVTVLLDLFAHFNVEQDEIDCTLGTANVEAIGFCEDILNSVDDSLGALTSDGVMALCGRDFFKRFITLPSVQKAYQFYMENGGRNLNPLRDDTRYKGFQFGGIIWGVYRGKVGNVPFVEDMEAHAFPLGNDLYETNFAPADYLETVNTPGLPMYAKLCPDPSGKNKHVVLDTQSNQISIAKRPDALKKLISSN